MHEAWVNLLIDAEARDRLEPFEDEWPLGMPVTEENIMRAYALGLDVAWLVCRLIYTGKLTDSAIEQGNLEYEYRMQGNQMREGRLRIAQALVAALGGDK